MIFRNLTNNLRNAGLDDLEITERKNLSDCCTLGVGGFAEFFVEPREPEKLRKIITFLNRSAEKIPLYIIGGGSNILFPDGLIKGIVISTKKLNSINWLEDSKVEVQAGYILSKLLRELSEHNMGGLEFASGIPGTVGGAVFGNAGTSGAGICDFLDEVITLESNGEFKTWKKNDFKYSYRYCEFSEKNNDSARIIISCKMKFREAGLNDKNEIQKFLDKRKNQPVNFRNAGCTFKNPQDKTEKSAGQLLDECGCKGLTVGGAVVSDKHANFILNVEREKTSSADILKLVKLCRARVFENTGILLEPEIKFLAFNNAEMESPDAS